MSTFNCWGTTKKSESNKKHAFLVGRFVKKKEGRKFDVEKIWKRDERQLLLFFFSVQFFFWGWTKLVQQTATK